MPRKAGRALLRPPSAQRLTGWWELTRWFFLTAIYKYDILLLTYFIMCYNSYSVVTMEITTTTKGRVVIPSSVRRKLGIKTGTRIQVELDEANAQIILKPITREYIHSLRGRFRGLGLLKELAAEKEKEKML